MYNPPGHRVDDPDDAFDMIEQAGFGHLVSFGMHGFNATALPLLVDRSGGTQGLLRGHVARANPQWKRIDGSDVFVLFSLADGYVSPGWYPSKAEHAKVVPTWNYEVVHVHGTAQIHDDIEWVRQLVTDLTDRHEAATSARVGQPAWAVTDAPDSFVDQKLRAIVGVEVEISLIQAKRKISKDRSSEDQLGVANGLASSPRPTDQALAEAMRSTHD